MEEAQNLSSQDQDGLAGEVMESVGVSHEEPQEPEGSSEQNEGKRSADTLSVQKRLKSQRRAHEREVHGLHTRISDLESRLTQPNMPHNQTVNPYGDPQGSNVDEQIHKAVSYALQHKEMEERKARDAQQVAHVQRQYHEFKNHLDTVGDKYDDFHDVVLAHDTPYTTHMRDYALTLPKSGAGSAGEVLYKLGKNPEELKRIANLHPLDQASEMAKLSHALITGGENKSSQSKMPLGSIKSNPVVNSHAVTDKTPVSELRKRITAGWK